MTNELTTKNKFYATIILKVAVNQEPEDTTLDTCNKLIETINKFDFNGEIHELVIEDYNYVIDPYAEDRQ